jgi:hypothetical protein
MRSGSGHRGTRAGLFFSDQVASRIDIPPEIGDDARRVTFREIVLS